MKTIILLSDLDLINNVWYIALLVIVVLLVVAITVLYTKLSKLSDEVEKNTGYRKSGDARSFPVSTKVTGNNDILGRLAKLENAAIEKQESKSEIVTAPAIISTPKLEAEKRYEFELSVPDKPKVIEFYMSTPNPDGSFEADQGSDLFRQTISLFKFTSDPKNPLTASFEFFSDDSGTKDALSNPKRYLEPVCYEENDAFTGAKKIVITKEGIAYKNGDKWIVDKNNKLRIKYQ
jgi:hypothetical protein